MSAVSMACFCVLAQSLQRLWIFCLALIPLGVVMGISNWGYLMLFALVLCVLVQIPLFVAYLVHRRLTTRHPELCSVTLAFPSITTALWILSSLLLPIGSQGSPAYNMAGQNIMLIQCCALFGRSCVTFLLCWLGASAAHCWVNKSSTGLKAAIACCLVVTLCGGLRFYAPTFLVAFQPPETWGDDRSSNPSYYGVSCLDLWGSDMEAGTQERLDAGDTIIIHAERRTDSWDDPVSRYQSLLQQHYAKKQVEALVVLSMVEDDRSWYHLVTRKGSVMSYAKNYPVPFVEGDIGAGLAKPKVAHVQLSSPISVTGSICFDTDFPYFTRSLSSADLLLETSATWSNIGRQHLRSHQFAAVENGQTLVKCTANGFTGAISPHGSILYQAPQTTGVVSFMLPLYPKLGVFPMLYLGFDVIVGLAALLWVLLAMSPQLSTRCLGRCHLPNSWQNEAVRASA
eukprot:Skav210289  [mRNA]  locus=scaffold475:17777:19144:- [translate_table: standard]